MKKLLNRNFLAGSLTLFLILGSVQTADAKFWGKDDNVLFQTTDAEGNCIEYYTETQYILWIKVSESGALERPC